MLTKLLDIIERRRLLARNTEWLKTLDDHRLRDLGIARDQIDLAVKGKL